MTREARESRTTHAAKAAKAARATKAARAAKATETEKEPRAETPRAPRAETPRAETPKAETPRTETPRTETPRTPKSETPRAPKTEREPKAAKAEREAKAPVKAKAARASKAARAAKTTKRPAFWGRPPISTKQERSERRFSILSNLLTLLLTAIIIAGGFLLPTLLYPYLDFYQDELTQLADPTDYVAEEYIPENPVILYPWNLYDKDLLRPLDAAEIAFLKAKDIHGFLLAYMCDFGLELVKEEEEYFTQIIDSFRYLEPLNSSDPSCFVLGELDINGDGTPDLRCAVSLKGTIISLQFLSDMWDAITITSPIGIPVPSIANEGETEGEGPGAVSGEENPGVGEDQQAGQTGQNGQATTADEAQTTGGEVLSGNPDVGQENTNEGNANITEPNLATEHPPVPEDLNIWSFAYVTSREARSINQVDLFNAFRQIEYYYEVRYSYPYTLLLPIQSSEEEVLPEIEYVTLTPLPLRSDKDLLHIYSLPGGDQLVLYLESASLRCFGFSLLLSS